MSPSLDSYFKVFAFIKIPKGPWGRTEAQKDACTSLNKTGKAHELFTKGVAH